jgi:hypothetical protein
MLVQECLMMAANCSRSLPRRFSPGVLAKIGIDWAKRWGKVDSSDAPVTLMARVAAASMIVDL